MTFVTWDKGGALTCKLSAMCDDDKRAKILAHAMKLPDYRRLCIAAENKQAVEKRS